MFHYLYTWPGTSPLMTGPTWTEFATEIGNGVTKLGPGEFLIYVS